MGIHDVPLSDTEDIFDYLDDQSALELYLGDLPQEMRDQWDLEFACSCPTKEMHHAFFESHVQTCAVHSFDAWNAGLCEWSHTEERFFYYPDDKDADVIERFRKFFYPLKESEKTQNKPAPYGQQPLGGYGYGVWADKCDRHNHQVVTYPDGTIVHASSSGMVKEPDGNEYAVYAYDTFSPKRSIVTVIPWVDFGLPRIPDHMVEEIMLRHLELARAGRDVEFGCMGGHGRTGTMLAILATECGVEPAEAVKWVRDNYCEHAVEGGDQEWYVLAFAARRRGEEIPEKPKFEPKSKGPAPVREGWCPECKRKITSEGCDGYGCEHYGCRLYAVKATAITCPKPLQHEPPGPKPELPERIHQPDLF